MLVIFQASIFPHLEKCLQPPRSVKLQHKPHIPKATRKPQNPQKLHARDSGPLCREEPVLPFADWRPAHHWFKARLRDIQQAWDLRLGCRYLEPYRSFRKLGVPYFGGPSHKDPTIQGTISLFSETPVWVVVKIMVSCVPIIIRHLSFRVPKKGPSF